MYILKSFNSLNCIILHFILFEAMALFESGKDIPLSSIFSDNKETFFFFEETKEVYYISMLQIVVDTQLFCNLVNNFLLSNNCF